VSSPVAGVSRARSAGSTRNAGSAARLSGSARSPRPPRSAPDPGGFRAPAPPFGGIALRAGARSLYVRVSSACGRGPRAGVRAGAPFADRGESTMVTGQVRAFVRRHPAVRHATRQLRIRLPRRLGGLDTARVPPRVRRFTLLLPRRADGPAGGPDELRISVPGDLSIPARLHRYGLAGYRPDALACFLAALETVRPGAVLDVGANVGVYAALAAARSGRDVYAFEPCPQAGRAARAIAADNGLRMEVVDLALSNHTGSARLHLSATSDATNSLTPGFRPEVGRIPVRVG